MSGIAWFHATYGVQPQLEKLDFMRCMESIAEGLSVTRWLVYRGS
jgi:hypothetical protein